MPKTLKDRYGANQPPIHATGFCYHCRKPSMDTCTYAACPLRKK